MLDEIAKARADFDAAAAAAHDVRSLDEIRIRFLGRKSGLVHAFFARLKEVPKEQKKEVGDALNKLRDHVEQTLEARIADAAAAELRRDELRDTIDVTLPPRPPALGH